MANIQQASPDIGVTPAPAHDKRRHLPVTAAFGWLAAGWRDLWRNPLPSLAYGLLVFLGSAVVVWGLFQFQLDYILLPALAGFMVVGPLIAVGLYQKSLDLEEGRATSLTRMVLVKAESGAQVWFTGAMLCLLMLLWMRAAIIIYALFFGLKPFPGLGDVVNMLATTPLGWWMLVTGTAVGGLFAAFGFAIGSFSIPMLLDRKIDAFTAMGSSMAMVWANLPVMLTWAVLVWGLTLIAVATGLLGLIVIFPLLGHAAWHSYRAVR